MYPFGQQRQPDFFEQKRQEIEARIKSISDINRLNDELIQKTVERNTLALLQLHTDNYRMGHQTVNLSYDQIPPDVTFGSKNEFEISSAYIPFTGGHSLAEAAIGRVEEKFVVLLNREVQVKTYVSTSHPEREKALAQLKQRIQSVQGYFTQYNDRITRFNEELQSFVASRVNQRKFELEVANRNNNFMDPFK